MIYGLAERLQELRLSRRLSQKEVAHLIGLSASVISNYESGERTPSVEILVALARLYHCSTDYLLGFDTNDVRENINVSMLNDGQRELLQSFLLSLIKPE